MASKRFAALILLSAFALSGCSRAPMLYLLNNTGRVIEIIHASNDDDPSTSELDRGWLPLPYLIWEGQGRDVTWSRGHALRVLIGAGDCRALYEFPALSETPHNNYFVVRIERDMSVVMVAQSHSPYASEDFPTLQTPLPGQPGGFPMYPISVAGCAWNPIR